MTVKTEPFIHDKTVTFHDDPMTDQLGFVHTQHIPDDFVAALKRDKMDSARAPTGDFYRVASIPVSVVEDLLLKGYDVHKEPVRDTIRMLKLFGLDAFITTDKRI